jgi:anaerobic magnesium-protoporphyrin IX monomethyl ester cyclase
MAQMLRSTVAETDRLLALKQLQPLSVEYFLLNSQICRQSGKYSQLRRAVQFIIRSPIRWRLNSSHCFFPWELWLAAVFERFALRRSLVTGQELPKLPANAC